MQLLKTSPRELFARAQSRSHRSDVGQTANWVVRGNGPRILFVHGFRGDHHGLLPIAGAMEDAEIWVPDLPGYGKTAELENEHNLQNYGAWLNDYVLQAGTFDLVVGHSFGTLVTAAAMEQGLGAPVVLLNPITSRASEIGGVGQAIANRYYRLGSKVPSVLSSAALVRGMSALLTKSKKPSIRSFAHSQHAKHFSSFVSPRVVIEGFRAASTGSVFDYAQSLTGELLLIAGERDIVAPLSKTLELANKLPNSQLEVIPKVGHLTHYETPNEVARLLESFVRN